MSNIVLSAGIRQNLLSLQNTATLMEQTQNRLATGKKVNSALDNPISFFTSQSLGQRATDLSSLLDSIGQGQQTLQTASQGITSLTTLVNSLKSIATQAQQSTAPTATYTNNIVGNTAIAADTSHAVSSGTAAALTGLTPQAHSTYTIDTAALATAAATNGDTITLSDGTHSITLEKTSGGAAAAGHVGFTNKADIKAALASFFGSQYSVSSDTATITGSDYTTNFTAASYGGADSAALTSAAAVTKTNSNVGSSLTISAGSNTATLHYVSSGAGAGTFTTAADLAAAINASSAGNTSGTLNANIHATVDTNGNLNLDALSANSFSASGALATSLGLSSSAVNNATLSGLTGVLSIKVGTAAAQTIDFSTIHTKAALTTALAGLTGVTGGFDGSGHVTLSSTTSDDVTVTGTNNSASGLFSGANVGVNSATVAAGTASTTRSGLQAQYNSLLTQIDQLASDSSYNGINLLHGDTLKVVFNEDGTSALNISGSTLDSAGMGLTSLSGNEFQSNSQIDSVVGNINSALTQLRAQASAFGSTLTTVEARQDFTKNLINTLQTGSDNLVLADTNEEGANLLALQTRQSLSTTALSLANQANQAVLRLFG